MADTKSPILEKLIADLHAEAGFSGMVRVLELLKGVPLYKLEDEVGVGPGEGLPHPMPMAFANAWEEVFALFLAEAKKGKPTG